MEKLTCSACGGGKSIIKEVTIECFYCGSELLEIEGTTNTINIQIAKIDIIVDEIEIGDIFRLGRQLERFSKEKGTTVRNAAASALQRAIELVLNGSDFRSDYFWNKMTTLKLDKNSLLTAELVNGYTYGLALIKRAVINWNNTDNSKDVAFAKLLTFFENSLMGNN